MRENLMTGSMWQGMETRISSSNPRRHSLTLPPDAGDSGAIPSIFLRLSLFPVGQRSAARPSAGTANVSRPLFVSRMTSNGVK
jgi:hypothetical protein